jgi:hypothetical protein
MLRSKRFAAAAVTDLRAVDLAQEIQRDSTVCQPFAQLVHHICKQLHCVRLPRHPRKSFASARALMIGRRIGFRFARSFSHFPSTRLIAYAKLMIMKIANDRFRSAILRGPGPRGCRRRAP